jgi:hypothetical protein
MSFAAALKAFLCQDPNIITKRNSDLETGGTAIKAALTGHLVLDAPHLGARDRLVSWTWVSRPLQRVRQPRAGAATRPSGLLKCAEAYKMERRKSRRRKSAT